MVRNLVGIALLAGFLEILLPSSNLRPFVRFAIGLFVVIAVLNPALRFLNQSQESGIEAWDMKYRVEQTEKVMEQGEALRKKMFSDMANQLKVKTEGQVAALGSLVPGVESLQAQVELDAQGRISRLILLVGYRQKEERLKTPEAGLLVFGGRDQEEKKSIERRLTDLMTNLYGLEPGQIEVEFEGG